MTWCLVLDTKGMEVCMAGTCGENSSGKHNSSREPVTFHWLWFRKERAWGLILVLSFCLLSAHSRGANFLTQVLLRPGASDLTGSFRWVVCGETSAAGERLVSAFRRAVLHSCCLCSLSSGCIRRRCWRVWWSAVFLKGMSSRWRWSSAPDSSTTQLEKWGSLFLYFPEMNTLSLLQFYGSTIWWVKILTYNWLNYTWTILGSSTQ